MARITLEISGIYFRRKLNVPVSAAGATVEQVMQEFRAITGNCTVPGGFDFETDSSPNPMQRIRHFFPGGITRSGKNRMSGLYELAESVDQTTRTSYAWQYYVLNADNVRVSATPFQIDANDGTFSYGSGGFDSFKVATFNFADDWSITWRLVGIVRGPNV
ncbi:MAG: hypothetical protein AAGC67_05155 [Myxococcota bacterium]